MDDEIPDVEMTPMIPCVDVQEVAAKWVEKCEKGILSSSHFEEYWHTYVPRLYSPTINESCLNWNFNEDDAQITLFKPLELFIFNGDPNVVLGQLRKFDKPPSVCGRVFKMGEPTYSCRECGADNTCVLCVDCFKRSEHRLHKYKMGSSGGGGCCDCGDVEAWKKAPFCELHGAGKQEQAENHYKLPEDLIERTRIVFEAILWYAYNLFATEQTVDLRRCYFEDSLGNVDTFCTVLYNDEIHTFEQVINTLNRVIKCSQRNAIEYVTNIDREGRAVVKCSTFQHCSDFKTEIEKYTSRQGNKPLKVLVVHAHVVAHQMFALKLLSWLQVFLGHGEAFRAEFAKIVLKPQQTEPCIIKGILTRDSQLWKSARTHWHRIFISGMLLEYENKKALAKIFTKDYGTVMKDFIKDDHEHSFSVGSLSVQLFTVPTLAHHLIANEDVLVILLNTFLSECKHKCNAAGKLEFERNSSSQAFKRAQYMLYDLRYLLSAIPETWTDDLRRNFLHGLTLLLSLLKMMQGMDSATRQVGQHMEYEPEWESAFNLHIKLAYCLSLALKWCGTDRIVLIKAYRLTLKALHAIPSHDPAEPSEVRELVDHSVSCIPYDVAAKPVSIHLPLSRFLAGLHLYLEKYGLHFDSSEFMEVKPTLIELIEPVLRTQVMIAQVHAGMWRRNGYALLNQLYFYHNVKCRTEMLDRDIQLLQIGASLIESNEFLIHLINKFNLYTWALPNFEIRTLKIPEEDSIRQLISIVEEFLQLLISIIGERYIPGICDVTIEDRIKKEIVQQLSVKPLPRSELNKAIPDDITHETGLDEVIEKLADFKKPQGSGKGVYELRDEFFDDYNVFFYHYTREDLSKSEEMQRKRRKLAGGFDCCPPPALPKLKESFHMIVNLLQCDVMLHIMQTVLDRCINLKARSFSELQLHKILHLIGYALQEEQSGNYPFLLFAEKAAKWRLPQRIEELISSPRVDSHKDMLRWTLNKYKQVARIGEYVENVPSTSVTQTTTEKDDDEKKRKAKLAAQRRAKVMAQMAAMQNQFMKENAKLFEETETDQLNTSNLSGSAMDLTEKPDEQPVCLGLKQTSKVNIEKTYTCILCQETQKLTLDGPVLVLAGFVHQATVLCVNRMVGTGKASNNQLLLNANKGPAPHTSTCGHVMHATCWQKYYDNVTGREQRRPYRLRHPASFDVDKQEFLCPLCECLSNTALPLLPPLSSLQAVQPQTTISFGEWLSILTFATQSCSFDVCIDTNCATCWGDVEKSETDEQMLHENPAEQISKTYGELGTNFIKTFPTEHPNLSEELINMIHIFIQTPYTRGLNTGRNPEDSRIAPMTWKSLAYTIRTVEVILRDSNKPLLGNFSSRHRDALETLIRITGVLGSTWKNNAAISDHAVTLLSLLITHETPATSILDYDGIGLLVALTFSLPSLLYRHQPAAIPVGGTLELHILHLVFANHIVRVLSTMNMGDLDESYMDVEDPDLDYVKLSEEEQKPLIHILKLLKKYENGLNITPVWRYVQSACIPFLRCCAILYHFLTDVPPLPELTEIGGDTFDNICAYLSLPNTAPEILTSECLFKLIDKWCNHTRVLNSTPYDSDDYDWFAKMEPHTVNQLIELPSDYSELMNTVSCFTCPNTDHEDSRNPTMCLVCGEILCSQSYCCQTELNKAIVGACNYHAHKCGSGVGIFLRVRECEILFLASPLRGCFVSPPYLDDYGETDQGLRRGNPLRLCPEKYKKLHSLWLNHSMHEEIARAIESSNNIVATQWQHL